MSSDIELEISSDPPAPSGHQGQGSQDTGAPGQSSQDAGPAKTSRLPKLRNREEKTPEEIVKEIRASQLKQQELSAWKPKLTAPIVAPSFLVIGIACIAIGIGLLSSQATFEQVIEYTDCKDNTGQLCSAVVNESRARTCLCVKNFTLEVNVTKNVILYYQLTNFFQNHRRYVKSRDLKQLGGKRATTDELDSKCEPWRMDNATRTNIWPCGAIANSMFNDTITLKKKNGLEFKKVPLLNTGIAWPNDKSTKFRNPVGESVEKAFEGTVKPLHWSKEIWQLDPENPENNGFQNEDFIVWMRPAAFPHFRKPYRRVDHDQPGFEEYLPAGDYQLNIEYRFPINAEGTKSVVVTRNSWMGGKNSFMSHATIAVGVVCLVFAVACLVINWKFPLPKADTSSETPL